MLLAPMAQNGEEPIGSMGTDTPLAVLSERPRLLYDYFKQLFAQVTNPPLDAIREELVTSMGSTIGPEGNLLEPRARELPPDQHRLPDHRQRRAGQAAAHHGAGFRSVTLPMLFARRTAAPARARARGAERAGARGGRRRLHDPDPVGPRRRATSCAPIPSLLATAGVHHHLVREGTRTRCALVVETGDAREVHHCRAADRLWRRRGEPVPGVRDASTT